MSRLDRILLVEDDVDFAHEIKDKLEVENICHVDCASNYEQGFELGCRNDYRVAVIDLHLGDKDPTQLAGLNLIRDLQDEGREFFFLVFSGHISYATRVRCYKYGARCFVQKPGEGGKYYDELSSAILAIIVQDPPPPIETEVKCGSSEVDLHNRTVRVSGESVRDLTAKEFEVLAYLVTTSEASMEEVIVHIYGDIDDAKEFQKARQNIHSFVSRANNKVETCSGKRPIVFENEMYRIV